MTLSSRRLGRRAIASIATASLLATGTAVIANPMIATAQESTAPASSGNGKLTVSGPVTPGGILTVSGSQFDVRPAEGGMLAVKFNDGEIAVPANQDGASVDAVKSDFALLNSAANLPDAAGSFTFTIRVPENLEPGGNYWVRILAGRDGGASARITVPFEVVATEAETEITETATEAAVNHSFTYELGPIVASVFNSTLSGFTPNDTLSVTIDGKPGLFHYGGSDLRPTFTLDAEGHYEGNVVAMAADIPGGMEHTLVFSDGTHTATASSFLSPAISFGSPEAPAAGNSTLGTKNFQVTVLNLKPGAVITHVGTKNLNLLGDKTYTVDNTGKIVIPDLEIPNDAALLGQKIAVTATIDGQEHTFKRTATINPDSPLVHEDAYTITSQELGAGLYQAAYSKKNNAFFVTRSLFTGDNASSIIKVNADSLSIEGEYIPEGLPGTDQDAAKVFGAAVDDTRDILWVTNTLSNSFSAYSTVTGKLIKAFPADTVTHPRAIAVDESTGYAYISAPTGDTQAITVVDGNTMELREPLATPGFFGPMELRFDPTTKNLYTVGFKNAKAARINVETGETTVYDLPSPEGHRGGGVAVDTKRNHLFVANQRPSTVDVVDLNNGQVIKTIVTGANPLDALYDAVHDRVVVINRESGTATTINPETYEITSNVGVGFFPNQLSTDSKGNIFVVNKPTGGKIGKSDSIFKLSPITPAEVPNNDDSSMSSIGNDKDLPKLIDGSSNALGLLGFFGVLAAILGTIFNAISGGFAPFLPWLNK